MYVVLIFACGNMYGNEDVIRSRSVLGDAVAIVLRGSLYDAEKASRECRLFLFSSGMPCDSQGALSCISRISMRCFLLVCFLV